MSILKFKRGLKANLPVLNAGEPAFTTDTNELYVGNGSSNIKFAKNSEIGAFLLEHTDKVNTALEFYSASTVQANSTYLVILNEYSDGNTIVGGAVYVIQTPLFINTSGSVLQIVNNLPVSISLITIQYQGYIQINFSAQVYANIKIYKMG